MVRLKIIRDNNYIDELFERAELKCPHIKRDRIGAPYCGKISAEDGRITEGSRMVCDMYSLQLWCLSDHYKKCLFYRTRGTGL